MLATMHVLELPRQAAPGTVSELNARLRPQHGEEGGIEAAVFLARDIGLAGIPVEILNMRVLAGASSVPVVREQSTAPVQPAAGAQPSAGELWSAAAFDLARQEVNVIGCTSLLRLAGRLAPEHGLAPPREQLLSLLQAAPGFRCSTRRAAGSRGGPEFLQHHYCPGVQDHGRGQGAGMHPRDRCGAHHAR